MTLKSDHYASADVLPRFEGRLGQMLEELAALTDIESPSSSLPALGTCARYLASIGTSLLGFAPSIVESEGRQHLLWQIGDVPRIVLVGHYDTVHPIGTVLRFPFAVEGDIATGPGVCDMKGGVVIALHALRDLIEVVGMDALDGVCLLVNADEEIGSPTSLNLILQLAETAKFAVGFENAGSGGQIKTERRGCSHYDISVKGRAAHAGDGAEKGINALLEVCSLGTRLGDIARPELGTSVTPTMASAGTTRNTVPEHASLAIDVRCKTVEEQVRVDAELRALQPRVTGSSIEVIGQIKQPPLNAASSERLFEMTIEVAEDMGIGPVEQMAVGGSADTCRFAGAGVEAIDGFGAIGGDDHTESEWISVSSLPRQAALAAALIQRLLRAE